MKKRYISVKTAALILGLMFVFSATIYIYAELGWRRLIPAPYDRTDQHLVDRALDIYGAGSMSHKDILRTRYPVVVRLPGMTCVGLNLRRWLLGQDTTICFRNSDGVVVIEYDS